MKTVLNKIRPILLAITLLLSNFMTITTTNNISSNVCLAAYPSEDEASADSIYDSSDGGEGSSSSSSSDADADTPVETMTRHNDTLAFDQLFHVQSCPSRCLMIQDDEKQYTNLRKIRNTDNNENSNNQNTVRIFYVILIHNHRSANDALHLFRAIRDPRNTILIHFDKKVEYLLRPQQQQHDGGSSNDDASTTSSTRTTSLALLEEIESCSCGSNVRVESVHSMEWSKWSMNLPTLWGMEIAASPQYVNEWDVFINLSGDTIPIYTPLTMATTLYDLSYNFITSRSCETGLLPTNVYTFPKYWHKRRHYTHDDTEPDPIFTYTNINNEKRNKTVITYFGSQWIIVQNNFVVWLVNQLQNNHSWPSQFRDYLATSDKLMTDETFLPSVLMHINVVDDGIRSMLPQIHAGSKRLLWNNGTVSNILHVRYERMDEHYPTSYGKFPSVQRYQVPESYVHQSLLDQPKIWGPYFLGTYDLGHIRDSGALFARKVSAILDRNMVELLPVDRMDDIPNINWPIEISIATRPDWTVEKEMWDELHAPGSVTEQRQPRQKKQQPDFIKDNTSSDSSSDSGSGDDDEEL